jgi:hypothetical protein
MPSERKYRCRQGDSLPSIGARFGMPWEAIWKHPKNAELKRLRGDPNILKAGDIVVVPGVALRQEAGQTGGVKELTADVPKTRLRMRLLAAGQPRKGKPYTLDIGDGIPKAGKTDGDGYVDEEIPASLRTATLRIDIADLGEEEHVLRIGHLDPLTELSGVQQRLRNLGFHCELTGVLDEDTRAALAAFQNFKGLNETREVDTPTRNALRDAHGA